MRLMVCSNSTKKYTKDFSYDELLIVHSHPTKETFLSRNKYSEVWAIGGGSVIDTAKIISKNSIIAIPTTYSGASRTSHAVYWDNSKKCDIKTKKPITLLKPQYLSELPDNVRTRSKIDCLCHIMESFVSEKATPKSMIYTHEALKLVHEGKWLHASLYAGDAIEMAGTNILHALSYPLTAKYNIPHGDALGLILNDAISYSKMEVVL